MVENVDGVAAKQARFPQIDRERPGRENLATPRRVPPENRAARTANIALENGETHFGAISDSEGAQTEGEPPLRVCLISGAPESGRCGIHDYVGRLAMALNQAGGIDAEILVHQDWSPRGTWQLIRRIRALRPDIIQMQYPMIVGWRSVSPHLLGFATTAPHIVTLHEFTSFKPGRRLAMGAFAGAAKQIVFTTEFERQAFSRLFPYAGAKAPVIPIGSNIPFLAHQAGPETTIVHFGQIKPGRGLEQFLDLAEIAARQGRSWRFKIIGAPVGWAAGFVADMRGRKSGHNVQWQLNVSDIDAAQALRSATIAYLPYPDGVSERRGSLIAALGNGVPVVTTAGPSQTKEILGLVSVAANPEQACLEVAALIDDHGRRQAMREAGLRFVRKFDWARIAEAYGAIYWSAARRVH